ncbi:MAG: hypothetical protein E6G27_04365 [Actinobacteria bacterium]|nr:MAG: hypothetical protein E6G27_04365 [Actinomycetota bacterium]
MTSPTLGSPGDDLFHGLHSERTRAERAFEASRLLRARANALRQKVWAGQVRSCALRDWSGAIRDARPSLLWSIGAPVVWIGVEGELGGLPVWAYWERGRLSGDPRLLTHARLLVDMGTVFVNDDPPARVAATLEGPPPAVMLTLAQACDHVKNVDFEFAAKAG